MLSKTHLKRLEMLKNLLVNHDKYFPCTIFDMSTWSGYMGEKKKGHFCKTAACALGSAALWPPFNKMGLKLKDGDSNTSYPAYHGHMGYSAGADFFGISYEESEDLFCPAKYEQDDVFASHVISRINILIKQYK